MESMKERFPMDDKDREINEELNKMGGINDVEEERKRCEDIEAKKEIDKIEESVAAERLENDKYTKFAVPELLDRTSKIIRRLVKEGYVPDESMTPTTLSDFLEAKAEMARREIRETEDEG